MMKVRGFPLVRCAKMDKTLLNKVKQFEDMHQMCKGIAKSLSQELKGKPCILNETYFNRLNELSEEDLAYFAKKPTKLFTEENIGLTVDAVVESTRYGEPSLVVRIVDSNGLKQCVFFDAVNIL